MSRYDNALESPTQIARGVIGRGERLHWADRTVPARRKIGFGALRIVFFGLFFAGFAAFWMTMAFFMTRDDSGIFAYFPYFGVPFLLIGLAIMTSPVWAPMISRHTVYALTDRRVVMIAGRGNRQVRSADLTQIGNLHWSERESGIGDIMFEGAGGASVSPGSRSIALTGIYGVPNIRRVAGQVERARDDAVAAARRDMAPGEAIAPAAVSP